jgi:N-dimethylarginine dimethylaminohydrolase
VLTETVEAWRPAQPRTAQRRRFLLCPPTHFDVTYSINPWMRPERPTDTARAVAQWKRLREALAGLGHDVEVIPPLPGLPDMVFAANGATVVDGRALVARFRYPQRAAEAPAYLEWLRAHGYEVRLSTAVNEGEGDYLVADGRILAGTGFRTDRRSHAEAADYFGCTLQPLTLVDPCYYHLDTALAVLGPGEIMYYPGAFSTASRRVLEELYPGAIVATAQDAAVLGLNAVSDGLHVLLPARATNLIGQLRARGYLPIGVDLSELLKSGGGAKCCTLELRDRLAPQPRPTGQDR